MHDRFTEDEKSVCRCVQAGGEGLANFGVQEALESIEAFGSQIPGHRGYGYGEIAGYAADNGQRERT
ncbi:hypothetical protein [Rhodopirellula sp. MGV]|uniref:hypothetical protein n=1 Tax=Rhodopirellula sp. MGV TaxID=2023130 RepID=UPI00117B699B|nr:hypothetical protein [Rhodopirellula sp. MGV]